MLHQVDLIQSRWESRRLWLFCCTSISKLCLSIFVSPTPVGNAPDDADGGGWVKLFTDTVARSIFSRTVTTIQLLRLGKTALWTFMSNYGRRKNSYSQNCFNSFKVQIVFFFPCSSLSCLAFSWLWLMSPFIKFSTAVIFLFSGFMNASSNLSSLSSSSLFSGTDELASIPWGLDLIQNQRCQKICPVPLAFSSRSPQSHTLHESATFVVRTRSCVYVFYRVRLWNRERYESTILSFSAFHLTMRKWG